MHCRSRNDYRSKWLYSIAARLDGRVLKRCELQGLVGQVSHALPADLPKVSLLAAVMDAAIPDSCA